MKPVISSICIVLLCSCASVRRSTSNDQLKDSIHVISTVNTTIAETTIQGTVPGYTKSDTAGLTWYIPGVDTSTYRQSVKAGAIFLNLTSKPRRDSSGAITGRDLDIKAVKSSEEVIIPIQITQKTTEISNSTQAVQVHESSIQKTSQKNSWWLTGWGILGIVLLSLCVGIWLFRKIFKV